MKIKVKPLEWQWFASPYFTWAATSVVGDYRAWEISGHACALFPKQLAGTIVGTTEDDAKAAAQADYEARILSAIEVEE